MTSNRVMKTAEFPNAADGPCVLYKAQCECGSDEDIMDICIEYETDPDEIVITFHCIVGRYFYTYYGAAQYWCNLWKRIKTSCKVLFGGSLEVDGAFIIRGEAQAIDLIGALNEGLKFVKGARP